MRFLFLFALAFHMTLGPVCMMHTVHAAEPSHGMGAHEASMTSSDCPDCLTAHEPVAHNSSCAGDCISVHAPDLLTFAPQTLEMPTAILPSVVVPVGSTSELLVSIGESVHPPSLSPSQSVVLLL